MMPENLSPFHLAVPVDDLAAAEAFYSGTLGCSQGRRSESWIDFNFFGHQMVAHLAPGECRAAARNPVDGENVPVRHFGMVLGVADWEAIRKQIDASDFDFLIAPTIRFKGEAGEQGTFFVCDPAGNALEFKYFNDLSQLFAV